MHSLKLNTNVARTINLYEKMSKKKDELLINKFTLLHSTCFVVICLNYKTPKHFIVMYMLKIE